MPNSPAQLADAVFLFSPAVLETMEVEESRCRGLYTADRLRARKPELYAAAIKLRMEGLGPKRIGELLTLDPRTVLAVWAAEPQKAEHERDRMIVRLTNCVSLLLERLEKEAGSVPLHVIGLQIGQLIDKIELLAGRATSREEHVERVDIYAEWRDYLEKELPAEKVRDVSAIPPANDPVIGLVSDRNGANARLDSAVAGPPDPAPGARSAVDCQSDAPSQVTQGEASQVTGLVPHRPDESPESAEGGGGDRPNETAADPATHTGPRKF